MSLQVFACIWRHAYLCDFESSEIKSRGFESGRTQFSSEHWHKAEQPIMVPPSTVTMWTQNQSRKKSQKSSESEAFSWRKKIGPILSDSMRRPHAGTIQLHDVKMVEQNAPQFRNCGARCSTILKLWRWRKVEDRWRKPEPPHFLGGLFL